MCLFVFDRGGRKVTTQGLRVALFNFTQLVEPAESLHGKPHGVLDPVVPLSLRAAIGVGLSTNHILEWCGGVGLGGFRFLSLKAQPHVGTHICVFLLARGILCFAFTLKNLSSSSYTQPEATERINALNALFTNMDYNESHKAKGGDVMQMHTVLWAGRTHSGAQVQHQWCPQTLHAQCEWHDFWWSLLTPWKWRGKTISCSISDVHVERNFLITHTKLEVVF